MRRILRKIAEGNYTELGDISTLAEPQVVERPRHWPISRRAVAGRLPKRPACGKPCRMRCAGRPAPLEPAEASPRLHSGPRGHRLIACLLAPSLLPCRSPVGDSRDQRASGGGGPPHRTAFARTQRSCSTRSTRPRSTRRTSTATPRSSSSRGRSSIRRPQPLLFRLHLPRDQQRFEPEPTVVADAVRNYFDYRGGSRAARRAAHAAARPARASWSALSFLVVCMVLRELLRRGFGLGRLELGIVDEGHADPRLGRDVEAARVAALRLVARAAAEAPDLRQPERACASKCSTPTEAVACRRRHGPMPAPPRGRQASRLAARRDAPAVGGIEFGR
jgi:hypothetical protein